VVAVPSNKQVSVGETAHCLLEGAARATPLSEVVLELNRQSGRKWSEEGAAAAYGTLLRRLDAIGCKPRRRRFGFWLVLPLIPAALVYRLALPVRKLFAPKVWPVCLCLAVTGMSAGACRYRGILDHIRPAAVAEAYALFVAVVVTHELGHASAILKGGGRPGKIGIGMYLTWPVMWADVSASWSLPRRARMLVDVGGMYVQLTVTGVLAWVYFVTQWQVVCLAVCMSLCSLSLNVNVFMRFDGYWLLVDAFEVPKIGQAAWSAFCSLPRRGVAAEVGGRTRRGLLALYGVLCVAAWSAFMLLLTWNLPSAVEDYPQLLRSVRAIWSASTAALGVRTAELLVEMIVVGKLSWSGMKAWRNGRRRRADAGAGVAPVVEGCGERVHSDERREEEALLREQIGAARAEAEPAAGAEAEPAE
jgi:hypothetical protein